MNDISLNEKQKAAVIHLKGPMLVLAGPGSGKTTVIIFRIKSLIENYNVNPKDILVITFTKAAAEEMKHRFNNLYENERQCNIAFGTFHSYFFRIIRNSFGHNVENVLREDEKREIIKQIIIKNEIAFDDEEEFLQNIVNEISLLKNELIIPEYYNPVNCSHDSFKTIYYEYERIKSGLNKIDFDDMLVKCYLLLKENKSVLEQWKNRYKYILIDEFQDINKVQYECIKFLANNEQNIFVVGDDDQSIYKFRGARPEFILKFPNDFDKVEKVILDINYRSTEQIIKLSNSIISDNKVRYEKIIKGTNKIGKVPILLKPVDTNTEALEIADKIKGFIDKGISIDDIAVIYRTNIQARAIVDILMDYNIAFQVRDEMPSIYEHWITRDIFAYLLLSLNKAENNALKRIINKPKRYISKALISQAESEMPNDGSLLAQLLSLDGMKNWQEIRIEDFIFQLNTLKNKTPYDAFKYIRKVIGYDEYLVEYSDFRKISAKGLFEILDELQDSAKSYDKIYDFIQHINDITAEIKAKKKQRKNNILNNDNKGVILSTMHSVKGLEFSVVFIISAVEGVIPHEKSKNDEEIEEERRLFYVAVTRAKEYLYISVVKNRYEKETKPTRFLDKIIKIGAKK